MIYLYFACTLPVLCLPGNTIFKKYILKRSLFIFAKTDTLHEWGRKDLVLLALRDNPRVDDVCMSSLLVSRGAMV